MRNPLLSGEQYFYQLIVVCKCKNVIECYVPKLILSYTFNINLTINIR